MEMNTKNTITFYGIRATRAMEREIERRLDKWICNEQGWLRGGNPWTYSIEIERDGSPHFYHCYLRIIGEEEWSSHGTGKTLHDAITDALKSIRPAIVGKLPYEPIIAHAI